LSSVVILGLKCTKFAFGCGSPPDPLWRLQVSRTPCWN